VDGYSAAGALEDEGEVSPGSCFPTLTASGWGTLFRASIEKADPSLRSG